MAGWVHPSRAVARPVAPGERTRRSIFTGSIVAIASPAGAIILAAAAAEEAFEAEAAFKLNRPVRIALAGGDGVAQPGDKDVAHGDIGCEPLGGAVAERNVDRRDRRAAGTYAQFDFTFTGEGALPGRAFTVGESP